MPHKDDELPYEIFPEEKHEMLDILKERVVYLMEKLGNEAEKLSEISVDDLEEETVDFSDNKISEIKI